MEGGKGSGWRDVGVVEVQGERGGGCGGRGVHDAGSSAFPSLNSLIARRAIWIARPLAVLESCRPGILLTRLSPQGIHTTQRLFDEMIYPHLAIPNSVAKALEQSAPASPVAPAIEEDVPLRAAAQA